MHIHFFFNAILSGAKELFTSTYASMYMSSDTFVTLRAKKLCVLCGAKFIRRAN